MRTTRLRKNAKVGQVVFDLKPRSIADSHVILPLALPYLNALQDLIRIRRIYVSGKTPHMPPYLQPLSLTLKMEQIDSGAAS